nr:DNA-directed RNA polymerase I subunit rpa2 [Ipomoea batatas]
MFLLQSSTSPFQLPPTSHSTPNAAQPFLHFSFPIRTHFQLNPPCSHITNASNTRRSETKNSQTRLEKSNIYGDEDEEENEEEEGFGGFRGFGGIEDEEEEDEDESFGGLRGRGDEKDFDRDPEFADILGSCVDNPQKAMSKIDDRFRKKRNKILQTKTGSGIPMKVTFNKFDFSNSYIWFEFYNSPLEKDVSLICNTIRSWHIVGRLGGCNSMNMQLSQSPMDKRPSYDAIQGANVTPSTFYNIGDLEIQDNLARIWVDIGTSEPLLLDILINALTQISSDYIGIKQVVFGGSEIEGWKENLKSEDLGYNQALNINASSNMLKGVLWLFNSQIPAQVACVHRQDNDETYKQLQNQASEDVHPLENRNTSRPKDIFPSLDQ